MSAEGRYTVGFSCVMGTPESTPVANGFEGGSFTVNENHEVKAFEGGKWVYYQFYKSGGGGTNVASVWGLMNGKISFAMD